MLHHEQARWLSISLVGWLVIAAVSFAACGDGTNARAVPPARTATSAVAVESAEQQAVQQVFLDAAKRWNAHDLDGFTIEFTDAGLISSFGDGATTVTEARASLESFFGRQNIGPARFDHTQVTGDTGSTDAYFSLGALALHSKFGFKKVGTAWKLNSEESNLPVEPPAGAELIQVDLTEFAFGVDTNVITQDRGAFSLVAKNVGRQNHMLSLIRVPAGADVQQLLRDDSPDIEHIAGVADLTPGSSGSITFVRPLDPGRYVMVCFLPDTTEGPDGTAHVFKGMLREFTVQ